MEISKKVGEIKDSNRNRKGPCIICGNRVKDSEGYIQVSEGYCHKDCVFKGEGNQPAIA